MTTTQTQLLNSLNRTYRAVFYRAIVHHYLHVYPYHLEWSVERKLEPGFRDLLDVGQQMNFYITRAAQLHVNQLMGLEA